MSQTETKEAIKSRHHFVFMNDRGAKSAKAADTRGGARYSYSQSNSSEPEMLLDRSTTGVIYLHGGLMPNLMMEQLASKMVEDPHSKCFVEIVSPGLGYNYIVSTLGDKGISNDRIMYLPGAK